MSVNGANSSLSNAFTYRSSLNPRLMSVYPENITLCHDEIFLFGNGFMQGNNGPDVLIDGKICVNINVSDTNITCKPPPLKAGRAHIKVLVRGIGETIEFVSINILLAVHDFYPKHGSLLGGTIVTVIGEGFCNNENYVNVTIGGYKCHVETFTNTNLTCRTSAVSNVVVVDNNGIDKGN